MPGAAGEADGAVVLDEGGCSVDGEGAVCEPLVAQVVEVVPEPLGAVLPDEGDGAALSAGCGLGSVGGG
ncbi:MAG TPA: hypothetical protein VGG25_19040 [Streptosporangiaceae bacterium]